MPIQVETSNPAKLEPKMYPEDARTDAVRLGASLTLAKGTLLGKRASDNKHYAYDDSATTGEQVATCILMHDVKTDSDGNVYFGDSAVASQINIPHRTAPVYVAGTFDAADLVGENANGLADLHARLLPSGYYRIP